MHHLRSDAGKFSSLCSAGLTLIAGRLDYTEEISVLVSSDEDRFTLPKAFATHHSPYFSVVLSGESKESKSGIIRLPEVEVDTFKSFVQWLYTGEVVVMDPEDEEQDRNGKRRHERFAKVYILGNQL